MRIPFLFRLRYYDDNESDEETTSASVSLLRPSKRSSANKLRSVQANEDGEDSSDEQVSEEHCIKPQLNKKRHSELAESAEECNQMKFNEDEYCNKPVGRKSYAEEEQNREEQQNGENQYDEEECYENDTDYMNEMQNNQGTFLSKEIIIFWMCPERQNVEDL
jgi:hypothetical protein